MADDIRKPKIELVEPAPQEKGEHEPTSVFDDLENLRKQSKLTVQRKSVLVNVSVDKPANNVYFRVNADPEMMLDNATVLRNDEGTKKNFFYVVPAMRAHPKLAPRLRRVTLAVVYTWPAGNILLWPVPSGRSRPQSLEIRKGRLRACAAAMGPDRLERRERRLRNRDCGGHRQGTHLAGQTPFGSAEDRLRR
jgi:hypothetical protein